MCLPFIAAVHWHMPSLYRSVKYVGVIDIGGGAVDIDDVKGLKRQKDDMDTFGPGVIDTYQRIANFIV